MRKKRAYILACALGLTLLLSACANVNTSVRVEQAQPQAEVEAQPDVEPEPQVEAEAEAQPEPEALDGAPEPEEEPRSLTAEELEAWSAFLCQQDCYGFLLSSYETPLDANLGEVFYTGAGVGQSPTPEMVDEFLKATEMEEAYTDITFVSADDVNAILERRTGYTLEHFKLLGHDLPMYYSSRYDGYFNMAGDTNYTQVECTSGVEYPDGSIALNSREKLWFDDEEAENDSGLCTFWTTIQPDGQGGGEFAANVIKSGWRLWYQELGSAADEE